MSTLNHQASFCPGTSTVLCVLFMHLDLSSLEKDAIGNRFFVDKLLVCPFAQKDVGLEETDWIPDSNDPVDAFSECWDVIVWFNVLVAFLDDCLRDWRVNIWSFSCFRSLLFDSLSVPSFSRLDLSLSFFLKRRRNRIFFCFEVKTHFGSIPTNQLW